MNSFTTLNGVFLGKIGKFRRTIRKRLAGLFLSWIYRGDDHCSMGWLIQKVCCKPMCFENDSVQNCWVCVSRSCNLLRQKHWRIFACFSNNSLPTSDTLQRFQINSSMGWWSMWQPPTTRASLVSICMPVDFGEAASRFRLPYIKPGPVASLICKTNWKVPSPRLAHLEGRICNSTNKVVPPQII